MASAERHYARGGEDHPPAPPARTRHERRKRVLTQPGAARVGRITDAIVVKHGRLFLLATEEGDVPWDLPHGLGLYFEDTRFLDGYQLTLNGRQPIALSAAHARGYEATHMLTNPDLPQRAGPPVPKDTVFVERRRTIRGQVLYEELSMINYGVAPAHLRLDLRFRSRFEDIFVIRGFLAPPRRRRRQRVARGDAVVLSCDGLDGLRRETVILFDPPPEALAEDHARFTVLLAPRERFTLTIAVAPVIASADAPAVTIPPHVLPHGNLRRRLRESERRWVAAATEVRTSHPLLDRVLERSLLDLRLLRSQIGSLHYFAAGIPWFETLFGRDAALTALMTLPYGPATARETLQLLARYQAKRTDRYRDAEPGKILHELRRGELARRRAIPQSPAYYGSVDATLLFVTLLASYVRWTGDVGLAQELRPHLDAALRWSTEYADHDGDGYLDYQGESETGLVNQGWKDSGNAIVREDGSLAKPPIALCEVQAYAYQAWRDAAGLLRLLHDEDAAARLEARAAKLRERFERDYWQDALGCYAMALERGGRPLGVVSSNTGQVLWGGIAAPDRAARVAHRLFEPDMFSGWGIRTLSSRAAAYNPIGYHLGTVWPHDNALIGAGLLRYGQERAALRIFDALFETAVGLPDFRLPELYCGFPRGDERAPVRYPVACSPQAWAAASIPYLLWTLLGLSPSATRRRLDVVRPRLPDWLEWVELRGLPVGAARAALRFARHAGEVRVEVLGIEGDLAVATVEAPPGQREPADSAPVIVGRGGDA